MVLAATAGPKEDVQATIKGQFLAFLEGDVNRAFTYASSSIRSMFGTAQNFGAMVQRSYPMVWRSAGVTFLEHRETSLGRTQDVKIVDAGRHCPLPAIFCNADPKWMENLRRAISEHYRHQRLTPLKLKFVFY